MAHVIVVIVALAVKTVLDAGDVQILLIVADRIAQFVTQDVLHVVVPVIAVELTALVVVLKAIAIHVKIVQVA